MEGQRRLVGIPAAEGVAEGAVHLLPSALCIQERRIGRDEVRAELARLDEAIDLTEARFRGLASDPATGATREALEMAVAYELMLRSPEIADRARQKVTESAVGAEWAVRQATDETVSIFAAMDDVYLRERGRDVHAVGEQLLRSLLGLSELRVGRGDVAGSIAVAFEFSPLEVARLVSAGAIGLVAEAGGRSSHAAILARSYGLPFVAGVVGACSALAPGSLVVMDGARGVVVAEPDTASLAQFRGIHRRSLARGLKLRAAARLPVETLDGTEVAVLANIEALAQVQPAVDLGAHGIGLFRTEFLYLDRTDLPTETEQFDDACSALRQLAGKPATFRTLDLGGDKLPLSLRVPEGHNPALGVRSIRFSLRRPDIFRTQLRALFRAAVHGPLRIMFPLISGLSELREVLQITDAVKAELAREGVAHDPHVPIGIMIETPSAAMTADQLIGAVDFLSIGTNDLIQYAFAADRDNRDVDHLYHPLHPAVLRLIKLAIDAAAGAGKPISLCGNMAADPLCTQILLGLGLRELSVTSAAIPQIEGVLRASRLTDARALVAEAMAADDEATIEALAARALAQALPVSSADGASDDEAALADVPVAADRPHSTPR